MPKHILEKDGELKSAVVGTGPFKLREPPHHHAPEARAQSGLFQKGLPFLDENRDPYHYATAGAGGCSALIASLLD